ncbi:MAG: hypothetical protein H6Q99_303 [Proteobacteria bacterium]|nr:hypothetical protein [Pseudomonadota bacterium]
MTEAIRLFTRPEGGKRAVIRDEDLRFTLADVDDDGNALPLFKPASAERLILFAEHAAVGSAAAITHPQAVMMLATLALALLSALDEATNKEILP